MTPDLVLEKNLRLLEEPLFLCWHCWYRSPAHWWVAVEQLLDPWSLLFPSAELKILSLLLPEPQRLVLIHLSTTLT